MTHIDTDSDFTFPHGTEVRTLEGTVQREFLAERLLPCPFCGQNAMTGRAEGEKTMVLCANGHCKAKPWVIGHDQADAAQRWNVRATPQPAPDAMREALATRFETLRANYKRGWLVADTKAFEEFCFTNSNQISAALSTPMPPADGEIPSQIIDRLFERGDLFTARAVYARLKSFGYVLSPSATGAAEPTLIFNLAQQLIAIADDPERIYFGTADKLRQIAKELIAGTTSVRGDREAIARLVYEAGSPSDPKDAWIEAQRVADAILSLPPKSSKDDK